MKVDPRVVAMAKRIIHHNEMEMAKKFDDAIIEQQKKEEICRNWIENEMWKLLEDALKEGYTGTYVPTTRNFDINTLEKMIMNIDGLQFVRYSGSSTGKYAIRCVLDTIDVWAAVQAAPVISDSNELKQPLTVLK